VSIWIEDTARNVLPSWATTTHSAGFVEGVVLSPFTTPSRKDWKQSAAHTIEKLADVGLEIWFDPETHALQMPAVGLFRYYDSWDLWSGTPGRLRNHGEMLDHVKRVFAIQDELGVARLAPTMLLHSAQSGTSQEALDLSRIAVGEDPGCRLGIAGDATFWRSGSLLDAHIGALAQLDPSGWFVTAVRQSAVVPVPAIPAEIHGLCRTVRALSEDAPVHVSHGDLAGLPAIAAGGTSLGTGWDVRQKVSAYSSYVAQDPDAEGGGWFSQATHHKLLSYLVRGEARVLADRDSALSSRLLTGVLAAGKKSKPPWLHHAAVLHALDVSLAVPHRNAYETLVDLYESARQEWSTVAGVLGAASRADAWVTPLLDGLRAYGQTEGY
jgi:hypothetical protein